MKHIHYIWLLNYTSLPIVMIFTGTILKVNSSFNTFLKRNDRFFFHKLTTKYTKEEMLEYFVSNFL